MNANVTLLALCQGLLMTSIGLTLSASALVGNALAPQAGLATLPLAGQYLATLLALFPAARLMARYGRRPVFVGGALLGLLGVGLAGLAIWQGSFALFAVAALLIGVHNGTGQYFRFAAADAVTPAQRSQAISLVLTGGILAAFAGPALARWTRDSLGQPFLASFLALLAVTALGAWLASRLHIAAPTIARHAEAPRPLALLLRQPRLLLALAGGVVGYAIMNLLMAATPLAMASQHCDFASTAGVIQWHLVAMFAPSLFAGRLVQRLGAPGVMGLGALLNLGAVAAGLSGTAVAHFQTALVLLGVGWNFLYVGATSLLTECYRPAEQARIQALNDSLIFIAVTLSTLAVAPLLQHLGWARLNLLATLPVLCLLLALLPTFALPRRLLRRLGGALGFRYGSAG